MPAWFNAYYAHFQERVVRRLLRRADLRPGMRSLDLGCGTGRWTGFLLKQHLCPVGVDIGENALDFAARRWKDASFSGARLPYLGLAGSSFDLAISVTVLQHVPREQQRAALIEVNRVLVPSGCLLVCESVDTGDPSSHVFGNPPETWQSLFKSAGFEVMAWTGCEYLPHVKTIHWLRRRLGHKGDASASGVTVSQMSRNLRSQPLFAALVHLAILLSYPLEYLASWLFPRDWARLGCFLLRKDRCESAS